MNELRETPDQPEFWWWELPQLKNAGLLFVRLRGQVESILREAESSSAPGPDSNGPSDGQGAAYEVTALELTYAEFISAPWRQAWKSLDAGLRQSEQPTTCRSLSAR